MRNQHRDQWTNPPSYVEIKYSSVTAISGCAVQSNRARRSDYASAYTTAAANYIFEDLQEIIEQRSMLIVPSDSSVTSSQLYLIILPLSLSALTRCSISIRGWKFQQDRVRDRDESWESRMIGFNFNDLTDNFPVLNFFEIYSWWYFFFKVFEFNERERVTWSS